MFSGSVEPESKAESSVSAETKRKVESKAEKSVSISAESLFRSNAIYNDVCVVLIFTWKHIIHKLESGKTRIRAQPLVNIVTHFHLDSGSLLQGAHRTLGPHRLRYGILTHLVEFLHTILRAEVLELPFIPNRSQETFVPRRYILLAVATYFQALFELLQATRVAKLSDIITESDTILP